MSRLGLGLGRARPGIDRNRHLALPATPEYDDSILEGEEGVVLAPPDMNPRGHGGAALPDDNVSSLDPLASETLHAKPLRSRIAAVFRAGYSLLMSHAVPTPFLSDDIHDL